MKATPSADAAQPTSAAAGGVVGAGRNRGPHWMRFATRELGLVAILYLLYRQGRVLVTGRETLAREHATAVRDLQGWLGFPSEAATQAAVASEPLLRAANLYYVGLHFPTMILFLLVGLIWRPTAEYRWARNLVATQTLLALVIHVAYPLAPPRMFPEWGFVDTMATLGPSAYEGAASSAANQFAAMPSLHVGWAVLIALVVIRTGPRWVATLAVTHAGTTAAVVIVTANHWWLDGMIATALLGGALLLFPAPRTRLREPYRDRASQQQPPGSEGAAQSLLDDSGVGTQRECRRAA